MLLTNIRLKNWRNFQALDVPLRDVSYVLGPNASGKSNLLAPADQTNRRSVQSRCCINSTSCANAAPHPASNPIISCAIFPAASVWRTTAW